MLQLSSLPVDNEFSVGDRLAHAVGFLNDPERPLLLDVKLLQRSYHLTKAKCELAQELASSESVNAISARLGVARATVKTQLESVFAKTGTHRHADLVKLLAAFEAPA